MVDSSHRLLLKVQQIIGLIQQKELQSCLPQIVPSEMNLSHLLNLPLEHRKYINIGERGEYFLLLLVWIWNELHVFVRDLHCTRDALHVED